MTAQPLPALTSGDPSAWDQALYAFLVERATAQVPGGPSSPTPGCSGRSSPSAGPSLDLVSRAFDLYSGGGWSDTTLADELGLTEAGLAEILVNPLYAGRAIRHKGRPDEAERPARFEAPIEPALFDRVGAIRAERCTRHPGMTMLRRSYPPRRFRPAAGPWRDAICGHSALRAGPVRSLGCPGTPAASAQCGRDHDRNVQSGVAGTGASHVHCNRQAGRATPEARPKGAG